MYSFQLLLLTCPFATSGDHRAFPFSNIDFLRLFIKQLALELIGIIYSEL